MCLRGLRDPAAEQRVLDKGYPDLVRLVEERCPETARHNANDSEGTLIERYRGARNSRVGSETAAPELFAQNRHRRRAAFAVFWKQRAAQQRLRGKKRKELRRNCQGAYIGRLSVSSERESGVLKPATEANARLWSRNSTKAG